MIVIRRFLSCLLALAAGVFFAVGAAATEPPSAAGPLAGIPNLDMQYYEVRGRSVSEIRRAMNQLRPTDPNDGLRMDALTTWNVRFRWPQRPDGQCDLARAEAVFTATVRMPRLAEEVNMSRSVLARWRTYIAALETHEAGHVRHGYENVGSVLRAIQASSCANAQQAASEAMTLLQRWDVDYDRATRHGLNQGAHFP